MLNMYQHYSKHNEEEQIANAGKFILLYNIHISFFDAKQSWGTLISL